MSIGQCWTEGPPETTLPFSSDRAVRLAINLHCPAGW
jgi:hypothetical protein